jgi:putative transposase
MGLRHRKENANYPLRFITTTCNDWNHLFRSEKYYELLKQSMQFCLRKYEAELPCYVFMPNHIHLILHFPKDVRSSEFMCDFKKFTSPFIIIL